MYPSGNGGREEQREGGGDGVAVGDEGGGREGGEVGEEDEGSGGAGLQLFQHLFSRGRGGLGAGESEEGGELLSWGGNKGGKEGGREGTREGGKEG